MVDAQLVSDYYINVLPDGAAKNYIVSVLIPYVFSNPAEYADYIITGGGGGGGTDTLSTLSCNVGDVPSWNGSEWECTTINTEATIVFHGYNGIESGGPTVVDSLTETLNEGAAWNGSQFQPNQAGFYHVYATGHVTDCGTVDENEKSLSISFWDGSAATVLSHSSDAPSLSVAATAYFDGVDDHVQFIAWEECAGNMRNISAGGFTVGAE
jgi:hypothetical protein